MNGEAAPGQAALPPPPAHKHTHTHTQADSGLQPPVSDGRAIYLRLLEWAFTLFSSVRVLAYRS